MKSESGPEGCADGGQGKGNSVRSIKTPLVRWLRDEGLTPAQVTQNMKRRASSATRRPVTFVPIPKIAGKRNHAVHISRFHALNKQLAQEKDAARIAALKAELEALGGLAAYQAASRRGETQKGAMHTTAKWVIAQLLALGRRPAPGGPKLRLLDVGALAANYERHLSWIAPRAIDLRASAPGVEACDFFDFSDAALYDVVVLSLVVNFVGDAFARGRMIHKATSHVPVGGLVMLVLPLACVDHSRYCDESTLAELTLACGLTTLVTHRSKSLFYTELQLTHRVDCASLPQSKRRVVRAGPEFNNFCALLQPA